MIRVRTRILAALLTLAASTTVTSAEPVRAQETVSLSTVEAGVRADFPAVEHMSTAELAAAQATGKPIIVFDARSKAEYAVSHIEGARHVDPGIWASAFAKTYASELKNKTIVVYCSVGVRSSGLAGRIAETAREAGATAVYNLEGGLFRWHNERRPLVTSAGPTDEIHPFDKTWGRYVERRDGIAYEPGGSQRTP